MVALFSLGRQETNTQNQWPTTTGVLNYLLGIARLASNNEQVSILGCAAGPSNRVRETEGGRKESESGGKMRLTFPVYIRRRPAAPIPSGEVAWEARARRSEQPLLPPNAGRAVRPSVGRRSIMRTCRVSERGVKQEGNEPLLLLLLVLHGEHNHANAFDSRKWCQHWRCNI